MKPETQKSQAIREATRRWKVCATGPDATCQKTNPDWPRNWCDACVARRLLEFLVNGSGNVPVRTHYHGMVEAQQRRRARERAAKTHAVEQP